MSTIDPYVRVTVEHDILVAKGRGICSLGTMTVEDNERIVAAIKDAFGKIPWPEGMFVRGLSVRMNDL